MFLKHDSGGAVELRNQQVLGEDSPLEFDQNGLGEVDDAVGEKLLTMHRHVSRGRPPDDSVSEADADDTSDFDAAAFVDRTPMDDVIADIEAGVADDHLDAVAEEASRQGVLDAVSERQE